MVKHKTIIAFDTKFDNLKLLELLKSYKIDIDYFVEKNNIIFKSKIKFEFKVKIKNKIIEYKDKFSNKINIVFFKKGNLESNILNFVFLPIWVASNYLDGKIGTFIGGSSNASFMSEKFHIKVKANNVNNGFLYCKNVTEITSRDKDYNFINDRCFYKKVIKGEVKTKLNNKQIIQMALVLNEFHSYKPNEKIMTWKSLDFLPGKKVLCHGSLNNQNIIVGQTKISLIDYEWVSYTSYYWDLSYLFKTYNFSDKDIKLFSSKYIFEINEKDLLIVSNHHQKTITEFKKQNTSHVQTKK